jgi:hypothetical protein
VLRAKELPASWGLPGRVHPTLSQKEWSPAESEDAERAVQRGLDELTGFFAVRPEAAARLGSDAIESLINPAYSAGNMPELRAKALAAASQNLDSIVAPYLSRDPATTRCNEARGFLQYAIYAHELEPAPGSRTSKLAALADSSFRDCGSLAGAMGYDYHQKLASASISIDEVWDMVMWSISLTDAQLVPGLNLPPGAAALPPDLWRYLSHHPFAGARAYPKGANDNTFYDTAYLVTHMAYIATGYGRHAAYVADAPNLYRFLRENFYPVLDMGELDLTAEFVDLFRQYGCTEKNDLQVRDGTRYLLKLFHAAHDTWMDHREPYDADTVDDYGKIHKPWTGMSGIRARVPEPASAGTYGSIVRAWMGDGR